jgi:hypothetical protein
MSQPPRDVAIDEIREVRQRISAQFGHDPARLLEHYMRLQEEYRDRLLDGSGTTERQAPNPALQGSG